MFLLCVSVPITGIMCKCYYFTLESQLLLCVVVSVKEAPEDKVNPFEKFKDTSYT